MNVGEAFEMEDADVLVGFVGLENVEIAGEGDVHES